MIEGLGLVQGLLSEMPKAFSSFPATHTGYSIFLEEKVESTSFSRRKS
jgi:hypothetical protein